MMSLAAGDVAGARALGRSYSVRGTVVRGDQRGRELGYPTANVPTGALTAAPRTAYAGWLRRLDTGETFPAAISVGTNPTFTGVRERRVESYVLDRTDLELYGVEVEVGSSSGCAGWSRSTPWTPGRADEGRRRPRPRAADVTARPSSSGDTAQTLAAADDWFSTTASHFVPGAARRRPQRAPAAVDGAAARGGGAGLSRGVVVAAGLGLRRVQRRSPPRWSRSACWP